VGFILIDWWLISGEVDWFSIRVAILMVVLLIGRQGVIIGQSELRRYAELVNATTDLAFITDASGDIRLTNPAFRDALLIKESENSPNLSTVVTTGTSLEILISIASVSGWSGEITFIRKDGTSFPGTLSLIPIRDTREQQDLFAATGHDLTQVKLRESELHTAMDNLSSAQHDLQSLNAELEKKVDIRTQELKEMVVHLDTLNKDLQALDELKTEFVALVSHELRAPLTTIRTGLDILLKSHSELDQSALETIKLITDETSRLGGFVETILDISALEAGRFPVQVRPLSLTDLLEEVCTQFPEESARKRIVLDIPDNLPTLVADDQAVRSVLFHVLDNAVKYAPKGEVNLIASRDGTDFVIEVRDQGPGIPKAHREKVFEMFYRIDTSDSREVYGRGLGLTLAKRFMDVIGGSIEIIDPGPHGAVIRIKIPNQSQGAAS
jgi:signal transduction histidine kinase